jgi:hypothetical protein
MKKRKAESRKQKESSPGSKKKATMKRAKADEEVEIVMSAARFEQKTSTDSLHAADSDDGGNESSATMTALEKKSDAPNASTPSLLAATIRSSSFKELGVSPWLINACQAMGIYHPTDIQRQAIPHILAGKEVIGQAKTGSGKTAAFLLPIMELLAVDPYGVFAIVLTPTRELAQQIHEQCTAFGKPMNLRSALVIGGLDILTQQLALSRQPHIVIATPGRLAHHITTHQTLQVEHLRFLVFDEADRLMEDCFAPELQTIDAVLPDHADRQSLFFSATLNDALAAQASRIFASQPTRAIISTRCRGTASPLRPSPSLAAPPSAKPRKPWWRNSINATCLFQSKSRRLIWFLCTSLSPAHDIYKYI